MSWEVWTMPQKTSFCNGTLLRSDLRHFWPAGFVYVLIWLMILPIQLLRAGYDAPHDDGLLAENLEALLHNVIVDASVGSLVLAVVCGVVIPMAVYAYLMTPRSVGMMHALPVKRTTQYFSHFLAGFGLLTAGNLLIFLLSVLAQLPFGMVDWAALGQWLLLTELLELFFLSLGALCAMATGWLLAIPVLYVAVNFAALLLCSVVQFLQRWFYFGFLSPLRAVADAHHKAGGGRRLLGWRVYRPQRHRGLLAQPVGAGAAHIGHLRGGGTGAAGAGLAAVPQAPQ